MIDKLVWFEMLVGWQISLVRFSRLVWSSRLVSLGRLALLVGRLYWFCWLGGYFFLLFFFGWLVWFSELLWFG